jgi:hypothetical protein
LKEEAVKHNRPGDNLTVSPSVFVIVPREGFSACLSFLPSFLFEQAAGEDIEERSVRREPVL